MLWYEATEEHCFEFSALLFEAMYFDTFVCICYQFSLKHLNKRLTILYHQSCKRYSVQLQSLG